MTEDTEELRALLALHEAAVRELEKAWSGSNLGYHARVYYKDFTPVPAGAVFSREWGDIELPFQQPTRGEWIEHTRDAVHAQVRSLTGGATLDSATKAATRVARSIEASREEALSLLTAEIGDRDDEYLRALRKSVEDLKVATARDFVKAQLPGRVMSRDPRAAEGGFEAAVHQEVLATVAATRATFATANDLATMADRAAVHIERLNVRVLKRVASGSTAVQRVFIGHGHSPVWRELKDFIQDRLLLPWDEFNRVPVAGVTNIARLSDMLDAATVSFHILTAEDERVDGAVMARQNVVHEAGLFQGRLGFTRAIILLEEGCEEFTNIEGLGQIRFPPGRIPAVFEDVRRVLEREGIVSAPDAARNGAV